MFLFQLALIAITYVIDVNLTESKVIKFFIHTEYNLRGAKAHNISYTVPYYYISVFWPSK